MSGLLSTVLGSYSNIFFFLACLELKFCLLDFGFLVLEIFEKEAEQLREVSSPH